MNGQFPPSSRVTFFRPSAQCLATSFPTLVFEDDLASDLDTLRLATHRSSEGDLLDEVMSAKGLTKSWSIVQVCGQNVHDTWSEASLLSQMG